MATHRKNWRTLTREEYIKRLKEKNMLDVFPRIPRRAENFQIKGSRVQFICGDQQFEYNEFIGTYRVKDLDIPGGKYSPWQAI